MLRPEPTAAATANNTAMGRYRRSRVADAKAGTGSQGVERAAQRSTDAIGQEIENVETIHNSLVDLPTCRLHQRVPGTEPAERAEWKHENRSQARAPLKANLGFAVSACRLVGGRYLVGLAGREKGAPAIG